MNFLDLLFPKRCVGCDKLGRYICSSCYKTIIPIAPNECICPVCGRKALAGATHPFCGGMYTMDGLTSFFYYKDVVRKAIQSIKYRFVSDIVDELISAVPLSGYEIYQARKQKNISVAPIPLHRERYRFRGFNQSELLGKKVAQLLDIPVCVNLLTRTVYSDPQVSMKKRKDRLKNIQHSFQITPHTTISKNMGVLLFDDVFTTGATMREAASVLKRAGISFVWGVTIAR